MKTKTLKVLSERFGINKPILVLTARKNKKVRYSYLKQQFSDCNDLWIKLKKFVSSGDFTLGKELQIFEKNFAKLIGLNMLLE